MLFGRNVIIKAQHSYFTNQRVGISLEGIHPVNGFRMVISRKIQAKLHFCFHTLEKRFIQYSQMIKLSTATLTMAHIMGLPLPSILIVIFSKEVAI